MNGLLLKIQKKFWSSEIVFLDCPIASSKAVIIISWLWWSLKPSTNESHFAINVILQRHTVLQNLWICFGLNLNFTAMRSYWIMDLAK